MPYMYILQCADNSYYTGSTWDLEKRLEEHKAGEGANHTSKKLPVDLVYYEEYDRIDDAFYREKQLQKWVRNKKIALVEGRLNDLPMLAKKFLERRCKQSNYYELTKRILKKTIYWNYCN